jgi:shikimate kinase
VKRHVVLLGLPGSGKTTVGRLIAKELSGGFADVDHDLEQMAGCSIAALFEREGEGGFRVRERAEMQRLLEQPPAVLAPGGGWAAWGENLAEVGNRAFFVYLRTSPPVAARRTEADTSRPLLAGAARTEQVEALLAVRARHYDTADVTLDTDDRTPIELAQEVARLARAHAGW